MCRLYPTPWLNVLSQYRCTIRHIRDAWGDLPSRWVNVPVLPVRAMVQFAQCDAGDSMPDVVRHAQQKAHASADKSDFDRAIDRGVLKDEGLSGACS